MNMREYHNRRPDIVLFINGIPVSIIELKNLANEKTTIKDAYDQTHIRYAQDIPSLMKFDLLMLLVMVLIQNMVHYLVVINFILNGIQQME